MAFNVYKLRKWGALSLCSLLTTIGFFIGLTQLGFLWALVIMLICMIVSIFAASLLLKNPFSSLLEGSGLLFLDINSTGVIQPFIMQLDSPFLVGKKGKKEIRDIYDRETVGYLAKPIINIKKAEITKEGGLKIELTERQINDGRFAMFQWPVIFYNSSLSTIITKDFLSKMEKDSFAEHLALYLNHVMNELSGFIRDFGRYIVELQKPSKSWLQSKWVIVVVVALVILLIILFSGPVITTIQGFFGSEAATKAIDTAQGAVTPR